MVLGVDLSVGHDGEKDDRENPHPKEHAQQHVVKIPIHLAPPALGMALPTHLNPGTFL